MPNRIDEIRGAVSYQAIADRINAQAGIVTNASTISKLARGEMQLTEKWLRYLAAALDTTTGELLDPPQTERTHEPACGFSADAAQFTPAPPSPLAGLAGKNRNLWDVPSAALDELGINPGDIILVDISDAAVQSVQTGDPVVAQLYSATDPTTATTLLRQFIEPALLITNSHTHNTIPLNMRQATVHIKGRILHHIRAPR